MNAPHDADGSPARSNSPARADSATESPVLALRGLGHAYGDRRVLEGFDLELRPGEIVGLLGPNGSGKSTVIGLLTGLIEAREGRFEIGGAPVAQAAAELRRQLGVVFQSPSLDARLSVQENLILAAGMRGLLGAPARRRVAELLDAVRLTERSHDVVGKLSGGMRRRIDIARALLHEPRLLVLDEPSTGLDERSFRDLWSALLELRDRSRLAILVATHRPDEAEHCSRLLVLARGRTLAELTPDALRARVDGDLVTATMASAEAAATAASRLQGGDVRVDGAELFVRVDAGAGPAFIPRLFAQLTDVPVAVALRRPTLADAFYAVTGELLEDA